MKLELVRDVSTPDFTLGKLYADGVYLGETCEDCDRRLEVNPEGKVYGRTAIPRGLYKVILSYSQRFKRVLPEVLDVLGFVGVRIHGGNSADDTLGCPLLGKVRTATGVANCAAVVQRLIDLIQHAENIGETVTLEVR